MVSDQSKNWRKMWLLIEMALTSPALCAHLSNSWRPLESCELIAMIRLDQASSLTGLTSVPRERSRSLRALVEDRCLRGASGAGDASPRGGDQNCRLPGGPSGPCLAEGLEAAGVLSVFLQDPVGGACVHDATGPESFQGFQWFVLTLRTKMQRVWSKMLRHFARHLCQRISALYCVCLPPA